MNEGRTIFSQLLDYFPRTVFRECIVRYNGEKGVRDFSCFDQWLCLAYGQLAGRMSLRDIVTCLIAFDEKLYHAGFRGRIVRSTLMHANEKRSWEIYRDLAQELIRTARDLYADDTFSVAIENTAYALDSTTIDLCLNLFPWAHFRRSKAAVKMHTLLDLRGNIPAEVIVTHGKISDVVVLDDLPIEAGAIYIMDRGYVDFQRLYRFEIYKAFFITRAKSNMVYRRVTSLEIDTKTGVRSDQIIRLSGVNAEKNYPTTLRRVRFRDEMTGKILIFLTNNFLLPAHIIAELYKQRWQVELFFKWIKQHLHIKSFYGTSENAVKTQIWIALSVYVLAAIAQKSLRLEKSLYEILQILSVSLFEKENLYQWLSKNNTRKSLGDPTNQLNLFDN
jgi:IS4 transposase